MSYQAKKKLRTFLGDHEETWAFLLFPCKEYQSTNILTHSGGEIDKWIWMFTKIKPKFNIEG